MKTRKPRTKKQKNCYEDAHCSYDDGSYGKECLKPWSHKCDGNIHKCCHLKMQYLASLSEKKKTRIY